MKSKARNRQRELEKADASYELVSAWRSNLRHTRQTATERIARLDDPERVAEIMEGMERDMEAMTRSMHEEAQRNGLPVALVNGQLKLDLPEDETSAGHGSTGSPIASAANPRSPWIERRLNHHSRYGYYGE
jgi:hypothetical protein